MAGMGTYGERAVPGDLAGHLRCSWAAVTGAPAAVLPDGCLDLMWVGGELVVAGPDTGPVPTDLPAGTEIAAVRFRPGAAPAVLGVPAVELRDRRVPLGELWPGAADLADLADLAGRIADAGTAGRRVEVLEAAVRERLAAAPAPDPVALAVARALRRPRARAVAGLAARAGLSERQLHRRCVAAFGYGATTLDRVFRLQRFLALGRSDAGLAELAVAAGYADQAHLGHDCRALAGATPTALRRRVRSGQDGAGAGA
jgi:AraC-like DNA-binding protein